MSVDNYMNLQVRPALHSVASVPLYHSTICLQLANTEEFQNGNFTGAIGEILIRSVWPLVDARLQHSGACMCAHAPLHF